MTRRRFGRVAERMWLHLLNTFALFDNVHIFFPRCFKIIWTWKLLKIRKSNMPSPRCVVQECSNVAGHGLSTHKRPSDQERLKFINFINLYRANFHQLVNSRYAPKTFLPECFHRLFTFSVNGEETIKRKLPNNFGENYGTEESCLSSRN